MTNYPQDQQNEINPLAVGAEGIAKAVGIKTFQVYNLRRIKGCPIHNRPWLGLVCDPQELKTWILEHLGEHTENKVSEEKRPGIDILAG